MIFAQLLKRDKEFSRLLYPLSSKDNYKAIQLAVAVAKTHVLKMKILTRRLMITSLLKTCSGLNPHMMTFSLQAISDTR